jgi:hypothetical protein
MGLSVNIGLKLSKIELAAASAKFGYGKPASVRLRIFRRLLAVGMR